MEVHEIKATVTPQTCFEHEFKKKCAMVISDSIYSDKREKISSQTLLTKAVSSDASFVFLLHYFLTPVSE